MHSYMDFAFPSFSFIVLIGYDPGNLPQILWLVIPQAM
jgi:hypothetical protein